MGKHLKQEFYHLSRSWLVLLVLLALLIGSTVISGKDVIGEWCGWDVEYPYMSLVGEVEFNHDMEYQLQRHTIEWVKERLSIRDTKADTLPEVYAIMQRPMYVRVMWYIAGLVLVAAVLPTVFVRLPLNTGVPQLSGKLSSRRGVALGKVLVYFIIAGAISLITVLILSGIYAPSVAGQLGFGYCLRCLILRVLQDLAVLSVPLYIAFLCRSAVLTTVINLAYGCLCCWVNTLAAGRETVLFLPFPAWLHGLRSLWQPGSSPLWLIASALVSLAYILLFGWLSVRQFERSETKS